MIDGVDDDDSMMESIVSTTISPELTSQGIGIVCWDRRISFKYASKADVIVGTETDA